MSTMTPARDSAPGESSSDPAEIPGMMGLLWRLFAQPYRLAQLLRAVGVEPGLSLAELRARLAEGRDLRVGRLLTRLLLIPILGLAAAVLLALVLAPVFDRGAFWSRLAVGMVGGVALGALVMVVFSPLRGLALASTLGPALGVLLATSGGELDGLLDGRWVVLAGLLVALVAVLLDAARHCIARPSWRRRGVDMLGLVALGAVLGGVRASQVPGVVDMGIVLVAVALPVYVVGVLHLPFYLLAALSSWWASKTRSVTAEQAAAKVRRLLWLRHDLLPFALPGMERILVDVARADPDLGRRLLARAATTSGQAEAAEHALNELRVRALVDVVEQREFERVVQGKEPFLSAAEGWLSPYFSAAADIRAARASRLHHNREQRLEEALHTLRSEQERVMGLASLVPREHEQRLRAVSRWIEVVQQEREQLERDKREHPQVPTPFVAGPVLRVKDMRVFKGREDLVAKIEHFMAPQRRGTMLLLGQRRMGKSSLLNMLPRLLGKGTRLLRLSFQGLSGEEHRAHPHLLLAEALDKSLEPARPRPDAVAWAPTLDWMSELDRALAERGGAGRGEQVLVAIDEVERVETGIREGWTGTSFLDFLRAAGDRLDHIRILMISAHPLHRIGPHWADRLISVITIQVGYLEEQAARALCCPLAPEVFDFAALYPEGGIDRIVHETHRHPYLIQLVCDELCRRLNDQGRLRATDADIDRAIDRALNKATILFRHLWHERNEEERRLLSLLAEKPRSLPPSDARSWLRDEGYIREGAVGFAVAVPMLARWIREHTGVA
ncbi:MAG: hypothetical protein AAGF11_38645 [Myxococcota bacterium]